MDIIFDIDGTVANLDHRLGYIKNHPKNYDAFEAAVGQDEVIEQVRVVYNALRNETIYVPDNSKHRILFASGRSERCREETENWLRSNGFDDYYKLYMRPDKEPGKDRKDTRPDWVIKEEILEHMKADGYDPKICFDDRLQVVKAWPKLGVFCFCVNQGIKDF